MGEVVLKILDSKVIELDGMEVTVELRMIKNTWGDLAFKAHARFGKVKSPLSELREKYKKEFAEIVKETQDG